MADMTPISLQTALKAAEVYVLKKLDADERTWREISDDCGIAYDSLTKIGQRHRAAKPPVLAKLETYYRARERKQERAA